MLIKFDLRTFFEQYQSRQFAATVERQLVGDTPMRMAVYWKAAMMKADFNVSEDST